MTIGKKLVISFAAMLVLVLLTGFAALSGIGKLSNAFDVAVGLTVRKQNLIASIRSASSDMLAGQRGVVMFTYAKLPENAAAAQALFDAAADRWSASLAELRPLLLTEDGKRLTEQLERSMSSWRSGIADLERLARAGDAEGATKAAIGNVPFYQATQSAAEGLSEVGRRVLEENRKSAADLDIAYRWGLFGVLGLAFAISGAIVLIVRRTSRSLQEAAAELGDSANQVANAASQVSASSQALAQGSSEQAASLEETSASSEEITSMTRKNADNSRSAAELMVETSRIVGEANQTLDQMETSMREINESSDKVSRIIKVIDEIAFQTNILALNAAVEAARAGEAGMGFAVVADEVRNLAQRSSQAAKDTAALIEESIAKSNEGRSNVDRVASAIRSITESSQKVKILVDEVKFGSEEQARGIEQISKAISQMEHVTQKSAANAEETASAGEEMSAQAEMVNTIVDRLQQMVGRSGRRSDTGIRDRDGRAQPRLKRVSKSPESARRGSRDSLRALSGAVSRANDSAKGTVFASATETKGVLPLDEAFKEF
jgi:methyl-accepting chemotaxis protein